MITALLLSSFLAGPPAQDGWYWARRLQTERSDAKLAREELRKLGERAVPALRKALTIRQGHSRLYAASLLRDLGRKAAAAAPELADCVATKPGPTEVATASSLAEDCAWALVAISPPTGDIAPRLIGALEQRDDLSLNAMAAIGEAIRALGASALPALLEAVRSRSPFNFEGELAALGAAAYPALLEDLENDEYRQGALRTLAIMEPGTIAPALPRVLALLHEACTKHEYGATPQEVGALVSVVRRIGPDAAASLPDTCPAVPSVFPAATPRPSKR